MAFAVTGTGRCGTKWAATALQAVSPGPVVHEHPGIPEGVVAGDVEGHVSWALGGMVGRLPDMPVVHLMRDPWETAVSWLRVRGFERDAADHELRRWHIPELAVLDDPADRVIVYLVAWTRLCQQYERTHRYTRVRVEDPGALEHIAAFLGLDEPSDPGPVGPAEDEAARVGIEPRGRDEAEMMLQTARLFGLLHAHRAAWGYA